MLGGHVRHQGGDRDLGLQDPQGHRGRDPGARRHADEELARPSAGRQDDPQGGPRRHHRLLHQPGRERQVRGQAADSEGGPRSRTCRCGTTCPPCRRNAADGGAARAAIRCSCDRSIQGMVEYPKVKVCSAHVAPVFLDAARHRRQGGGTDRGGRRRRRAADCVSGIVRAGFPGLDRGAGADQEPRIFQAPGRQFDRGAGSGGAAALRGGARARHRGLDRFHRARAGLGRLPVELQPADRRRRRDASVITASWCRPSTRSSSGRTATAPACGSAIPRSARSAC